MEGKIKLILVEDRAEWIKTFEEEILKDPRFDYLGFASSKDSGIAKTLALKPDVVVMDIFLDASSNREYGIEAAKEIRIKTKSKIVFFTADDENRQLRKEACRIGFASGYIRKADYKKYADEIYNAVTKSTPFKESIIENVRNQLTDTENDILTKMIDGRIEGITKTDIYSQKNLSKNKTKIYGKFGLSEVPEKERESVLVKIFSTW